MPVNPAVDVISTSWQLLTKPRSAWQLLAGTPLTVAQSVRHMLVLATAGLLASTLGYTLVGMRTDGFNYHLPFDTALIRFSLIILLGIATVFFLALWANFLAPKFGATRSGNAALGTIAHAITPIGLWAILLVLPLLEILWPIAMVWAFYLLHLGLGALMKPQPSRHTAYTLSVIAGLLVLYLCLGLLRGCDGKWPALPVDLGIMSKTSPSDTDASNQGLAGQKVPQDKSKNGAGQKVQGMSGSSGTGGPMDIPANDSVSGDQADALEGVLHGSREAPTRSVLERYLPGDREDMDRKLSPSWAYNNPTAGTAQYLATGAEAKVSFQGKHDKSQYLIVTLTDLTAEKGPAIVDKLLADIVNTGGERSLNGGKGSRLVESIGDRMRVTEYFPERKEGSVEMYLGQRYRVRVDARPVAQQALYEEIEKLDLEGLEQRAKERKPIE